MITTERFYHLLAIGLGILATALFVLAVAVFYGYIPHSLVGNLSDTELGVFGVLAIVAAGGSVYLAQAEKGRR